MNFEVAPKETAIKANWYDAKIYCTFLEVAGKKGWRLPTREELHEIYQSKNNFTNTYYWSSTDDNDDDAWGQSMITGEQIIDNKNYNGDRVRAIRDLS